MRRRYFHRLISCHWLIIFLYTLSYFQMCHLIWGGSSNLWCLHISKIVPARKNYWKILRLCLEWKGEQDSFIFTNLLVSQYVSQYYDLKLIYFQKTFVGYHLQTVWIYVVLLLTNILGYISETIHWSRTRQSGHEGSHTDGTLFRGNRGISNANHVCGSNFILFIIDQT